MRSGVARMVDFYDELSEGDIHVRDKVQFELKSEYAPLASLGKNTYTLEFFFFVPTALQINRDTYSKQQFYYDQTNFIRLKTPGLTLVELGDASCPRSPLLHIKALYESGRSIDEERVVEELKLYANIARSAIRNRVRLLLDDVRHASDPLAMTNAGKEICSLCQEVRQLRRTYVDWQADLTALWQQGRMTEFAQYVDEFVSTIVERYSAGILQELSGKENGAFSDARRALAEQIATESQHRLLRQERSPFAEDPEKHLEYAVYRGGLLKKFVSEALYLQLVRKEPMKTFQQVAAAIAAGLAMLVYLYFLSFHSVNPVLDSTAFIILSVLLYVLKDRMKEGLKSYSAKLATGWFPDFHTIIRTSTGDVVLGTMREYFFFLTPEQIPKEIAEMRNTRFHTELEKARRLETVFYFRKEVALFPKIPMQSNDAYELNDIFRYNISRFLVKASDPYKEQLVFDPASQQVNVVKGPKVYHINIIIRKTFLNDRKEKQIDYKKYRVVLDKDGIKRIEKVG